MRTLFLVLIWAVLLWCVGCWHPDEAPGAWTIVKQRDHDNYGYVTEQGWGFVTAFFTNKAEAKAAMERARWEFRHPPKVEAENEKPLWEPQ